MKNSGIHWSANHTKFLLPRDLQAEKASDVIDYEMWILYFEKSRCYK